MSTKSLRTTLILVVGTLLVATLILSCCVRSPAKNKFPEEQNTINRRLSTEEYRNEQKTISDTLENQGLENTFDYFFRRASDDPSFARDCHPLLHYLGHESFHFHDNDLVAALVDADEICNSGYIHGVIQAYFEHNPNQTSLPAGLCGLDTAWSIKQWQCFHGTGHGYMLANNRDISKSIKSCELEPNDRASRSCINGVFMEFFILTDHDGSMSRTLEDVHIANCRTQRSEDKIYCYVYAPVPYLEKHPNDYYNAAHKYCEQADEPQEVQACQYGVGSQLVKDTISTPHKSVDVCEAFASTAKAQCIQGAVSGYYYNTKIANNSEAACKEAFSNYHLYCEELIKEHL